MDTPTPAGGPGRVTLDMSMVTHGRTSANLFHPTRPTIGVEPVLLVRLDDRILRNSRLGRAVEQNPLAGPCGGCLG